MDDKVKKGIDGEDLADELVEFAGLYYSADFPNPDREGCPDREIFVRLAQKGGFPEEDVREHLLSCSPCYSDFVELRSGFADSRASKGPAKAFAAAAFSKLGFSLALIAAVTAAMIYLGLSSLDPFRVDTTKKQVVEEKFEAPSVRESVTAADGASVDAPLNLPQPPATRSADSQIPTYAFDLARYSISRNSAEDLLTRELPAAKVRVRINLRSGSPSGAYRLGVLDEYGNVILPEVSVKGIGGTVSSLMNFTGRTGPARLCVFRGEEIPDCVPIEIVRPR